VAERRFASLSESASPLKFRPDDELAVGGFAFALVVLLGAVKVDVAVGDAAGFEVGLEPRRDFPRPAHAGANLNEIGDGAVEEGVAVESPKSGLTRQVEPRRSALSPPWSANFQRVPTPGKTGIA